MRDPEVFEAYPRVWHLFVGLPLLGAFLFWWTESSWPRWVVMLAVTGSLVGWWQSFGAPVLRVGPTSLDHVPFHNQSQGLRFELFGYTIGGPFETIEAHQVSRLEWDGVDNIGIRLLDGSVHSVSFLGARPGQRAEARRKILEFVSLSSANA